MGCYCYFVLLYRIGGVGLYVYTCANLTFIWICVVVSVSYRLCVFCELCVECVCYMCE